jgi:low affinity Fe/Cu permease
MTSRATGHVDQAEQPRRPHSRLVAGFDRFAAAITRWAGSPVAFVSALLCVALWAAVGRFFDFSENWQLVINTGTTIITFLMVFLIQQSQNKDSVALHLKLNELLAANQQASNRMIGIEGLDEEDLCDIAKFYARLAERVRTQQEDGAVHSIDENRPASGRTDVSSGSDDRSDARPGPPFNRQQPA